MFAIVPLMPLLAIPGAAEFVKIAVVAILLLFILWLIQQPLVNLPGPFKQIAVWVVAGALILFLVWEALQIAGIL
jgi:hypothetical protein